MKKTKASSSGDIHYTKKITLLQEMKGRVAAMKEEISDLSLDAGAKRQAAQDAAVAVTRLKNDIRKENHRQGRDRDFMEPGQSDKMNMLEKHAAEADTAAVEAEKKRVALNNEICELEQKLDDFEISFSVQDVLAYQDDLAGAEKKVADLAEIIRAQESVIERAQSTVTIPPDLAGKREDLLAEIALGNAAEDALNELDKKIAAERETAEKNNEEVRKVVEPARQAIKGLQRKLAEAQNELDLIKAKGGDVKSLFFRSQAERIGKEYTELALQLIEKFEKLLAYDRIMGPSSKLRGHNTGEIMLPIFRVRACRSLQHHRDAGEFDALKKAWSSDRQLEVYQAELENIKAQGINF